MTVCIFVNTCYKVSIIKENYLLCVVVVKKEASHVRNSVVVKIVKLLLRLMCHRTGEGNIPGYWRVKVSIIPV